MPTSPAQPNPTEPSRARAREAALEAYQAVMVNVSPGALSFLDDLTATYGQEEVAKAIGAAALSGTNKLLSRVKSALAIQNRGGEQAAFDKRVARTKAKLAAIYEPKEAK